MKVNNTRNKNPIALKSLILRLTNARKIVINRQCTINHKNKNKNWKITIIKEIIFLVGLKFKNLILERKRNKIILLVINLLVMLRLILLLLIILTPASLWEGEKSIQRLLRRNLQEGLV